MNTRSFRITFCQLLWIPVLLVFALRATGDTPQPKASEYSPVPMEVPSGFSVAAVGDMILQHPESMRHDVAGLVPYLKSTDVTFGNFENTTFDLHSFKGHPQAESGGSWLRGSPDVPMDVKAMGFNLVSRANNHATDWGVEGMLETDHLLDAAGLVHAGTGTTQASAREARFLQTAKGRIALISAASSFTPMSRSMSPLGAAPGRPGLNAVRARRVVLVTEEQMQALRRLHDAMPKGAVFSETKIPDNELNLFDVRYRISDRSGLSFDMNQTDLRENIQNVRNAKENADFLIFSMHAHQPGNWSQDPPDFLPKLAHAVIDNGADMFIGHGPHQLRGIEIYKGKPIFYSLGNFFFHENQQFPIVADMWEQFKGDPSTMTEVQFSEERRLAMFKDDVFWESVIAVSRFANGQVSEIRLYPIDLSSLRDSHRGIPRLASPEKAHTILQRLAKLSAPFGTPIEIRDNVGIIRISSAQIGQTALPKH
jgi:poly-gamma-glutamate synthesis protein (capsule biosynthesis protein)